MTEITKERRDAIRAAAIKATPGPWNNAGIGGVNDFGREHQASLSFEWMPNGIDDDGVNKNWTADTAHIANCDPQTILALLDALDAAEAKLAKAEEALKGALAWHEDQDKSLSKQPPSHGPNGTQWARLQHREQMDAIRAAISPMPNKEG